MEDASRSRRKRRRNPAVDEEDVHLGKRIAEGARARRERAGASRLRLRQASAAPAPASMESKYPVVSKIMASMGYKPGTGLGKDAQGIVAPLEGTLRPGHAGLGSVRESKPFFPGKENLPAPSPAEEELARPRWSRKAGARKDSVLTKSALLATRDKQDEQPPMVVQKVIDMRCPHARILTDLSGLTDDLDTEVDDEAPMPELQHNLRMLVEDAVADIRRLDAQLRREQQNAASLARDKQEFAGKSASHTHQLQIEEAIVAALEQLRLDAAGVLTLEALFDTFWVLKARHREEFELLGLAWIACDFALPVITAHFHGWQPLHHPSFGIDIMSTWKNLLQQQPYDFISDGTDPYAQLVHEAILPVVRTSGANSWDARDPEPILGFIESWEKLLPPTVLESLLDDVIMPKLAVAIDSWDPRADNAPIHAWVHPWLPTLGQIRTATLCHFVRYKLSTSVLRDWQAADDAWAYSVLSPWKAVFDPASWEAMMARYIVPKLKLALRELQISPTTDCQEELDQFSDRVMIWASAIPARHMVHMLEVDFFGKWHLVLHHWLRSPDPDFDEIVAWYRSWQGMLPPELLVNDRIRMLLAAGLAMMNQAAEGLEVLLPGAREDVGYVRARKDRQFDATPQASQQVPGAAMEDLSFKECIQEYAEAQGLLFMPRPGKFRNGLPVYRFGSVSVCLDSVKRLLYAQIQEGSARAWSSVSLSQLMEMNRMARPC